MLDFPSYSTPLTSSRKARMVLPARVMMEAGEPPPHLSRLFAFSVLPSFQQLLGLHFSWGEKLEMVSNTEIGRTAIC